jgi:hypothetical protein
VFTITEAHDLSVRDAVLAGKLNLDDFDDLQLVINWLMSKYFLQRGIKERKDLLWSKIVFGTYNVKGPLHGHPCVKLMRDFDKTSRLTLQNPTIKTNGSRLIYVHNAKDPVSLYTLLRKYCDICSQAEISLYCYKKSKVAINREVRAGNHHFVANLNKPKGYNQIKSFGRTLARHAWLVDWVRCTNHCWRAFGITRMSNSLMVWLTEAMGAARHNSATAHQAYVRTDGVSEQNRIMAMSAVAYR